MMTGEQLTGLTDLFRSGRWEQMEAAARDFIKKDRTDGMAWKALGIALKMQQQSAILSLQKAVELLPDDAEANYNYGVALSLDDNRLEAIKYYERALAIRPNWAEAWSNLGKSFQETDRPRDAIKAFYRAMQLKPSLPELYLNMGNAMIDVGQHAHALQCYERGLTIDPDNEGIVSNIIFLKDLMIGENTESLQRVRREWAKKFAESVFRNTPHANNPDPNKRLRIGYVSADFRQHVAAISFGQVITHHDRSQFDLYLYSKEIEGKDDKVTTYFKKQATIWRDVTELSHDECAALIRKDEIDILVDLSGHTGGQRLLTFARKPAPIQITAWGYVAGTGMKAMDVFFADKVLVPLEETHHFAEEVRYLPCAVTAMFYETFPEPNDLPALKSGAITFGSFNRIEKISDEAYALWARVLHAIPTSRIFLKAVRLSSEETREYVLWQFQKHGIQASRIVMRGRCERAEHLEFFSYVDIALDSFPHAGGVTTLEGLAMGIPVITRRWPTINGRLGASYLTNLGMTDWIAETDDEFVDIALRKSADLSAVAALRKGLPAMLKASYIGNGAEYTKLVEAEYRFLWQRWCKNSLTTEEVKEQN